MSKINHFDLIRERHHSAARLFAAGHSVSAVAHLLGASEAQLTRQVTDPAFRDLVSRYRTMEATATAFGRFQAYAIAA